MKLFKTRWCGATFLSMGWISGSFAAGAADIPAAGTNIASLVAVVPAGGVFTTNPLVVLRSPVGEIRYTMDGSAPASNSALYSSPLLLSNSCLLQARAFASAHATGRVSVAAFTLLETNLGDFTSTLPLVFLQTFGHSMQAETNVTASLRIIEPGPDHRAGPLGPGNFDGPAVIKVRGYTSRRYPKHSFTVELREPFGEPVPAPLLGLPADSDWVLYAPYPDKSLIRDVLAYELSNEMGHYASRTRFVEVFLNETTNRMARTNYAGVYVLEEKVKRSEHRVNIQRLAPEDKSEPALTGGYIFKKDHLEEVLHDDPPPPAPAAATAHPRHERVGFPTGPGGFPADPSGFLPPHEDIVTVTNILTATVIGQVTNLTALTNIAWFTNIVASTNAALVTNIAILTNTIVAPSILTTRHIATITNIAAVTNIASLTNVTSIPNQAPFSGVIHFTNLTAFTNVALFTNVASVTNTASSTNLLSHIRTGAVTNVASVAHIAAITNVASATNVEITTMLVWATNLVSTTNFVLITNTPIVSTGAPAVVVVALAAASTNAPVTSTKPSVLTQLVATGQGFVSSRTNAFFYVEPKTKRITPGQRAWLSNYVNRFEQVLYGAEFRNPTNGYAAYIESDTFIDQHLIVEATKNIDGFRFSTFFTKDRGAKIRMEPIWDWNLAFGNASGRQGDQSEHWYWPQLDDRQYSWFRRLFEDPDFGQRYVDRWAGLRTNIMAISNLQARVEKWAAILKEPAARNFERWPILGQTINTEPFAGKTYDDEIVYLKSWLSNRLTWVSAQFLPAPTAVPDTQSVTSGTALALTSAVGRIYFTLDGTDPRLAGGAVSASARGYAQPLSVTNALEIFARTQKENRWSSPLKIKLTIKPTVTAASGG
ncbi:MAG: hypothetical protein QOF48_3500 [Verrucomicrobiota bacterium]|jgi:hypothetical protein